MKSRNTRHRDGTERDPGDVAVAGHDTVPRPDALARQWQGELVELARRWEPYGGVPEEEIFVRFGISKPLFDKVLTEANNRARASRPPGMLVRHPSNRSL